MPASKKSTYQVFAACNSAMRGKYAITPEMYNKQETIKLRNSLRKEYKAAFIEVYKIEKI